MSIFDIPLDVIYSCILSYIDPKGHFILNQVAKRYKPCPKALPYKNGITTIDQFKYYKLKPTLGNLRSIASGFDSYDIYNYVYNRCRASIYNKCDVIVRDYKLLKLYYNNINRHRKTDILIVALEEGNNNIIQTLLSDIDRIDVNLELLDILLKLKYDNDIIKDIINTLTYRYGISMVLQKLMIYKNEQLIFYMDSEIDIKETTFGNIARTTPHEDLWVKYPIYNRPISRMPYSIAFVIKERNISQLQNTFTGVSVNLCNNKIPEELDKLLDIIPEVPDMVKKICLWSGILYKKVFIERKYFEYFPKHIDFPVEQLDMEIITSLYNNKQRIAPKIGINSLSKINPDVLSFCYEHNYCMTPKTIQTMEKILVCKK